MTEKNALPLEHARQMGHKIDFGKTASDYARFRAGFPDAFFDRLGALGVVAPGMRALDLGTGTGTVARGLAMRGLEVTGLDKSKELMEAAQALDREAGVTVRYVVGAAEDTGMSARSFDVITAGQCWHWFDRAKAAAEARRILKSGGHLVIGNFDWIPLPGNMVDATEKLIESYNPDWKLGGGLGAHPYVLRDMGIAGFRDLESCSFDLDAPYTHEAWRGRIRASAGVGAAMAPERVAKFDAELAAVLKERFPADPMGVPHRVFIAIGTAP